MHHARMTAAAAAIAAVTVLAVLSGGPAAARSDNSQPTSAAISKKKTAKAKTGKYAGKVGTFARISFKLKSKKLNKINAGVQATCQRASDGAITRVQLAAMQTKKKLKVNKKGHFKGKGQEENGVAWKLKGKFVGKKKAKGSFEASEFIFDPFTLDSELCAGSGKWKARLRR